MRNDPLYEALQRQRRAREEAERQRDEAIAQRRPRRPPEPPRPEGVTLYRCVGLIPQEEPASEYDESVLVRRCEERSERKPYLTKPYHHGLPMEIVGYDWQRDVDA